MLGNLQDENILICQCHEQHVSRARHNSFTKWQVCPDRNIHFLFERKMNTEQPTSVAARAAYQSRQPCPKT